MAKPARKPITNRKPPQPDESHAPIEQWLADARPDLQPIVNSLDRLFRETLPGLQFAIKWNKAHYWLPERGWVIEMVAYLKSVNIVFFGGADFDPPPPLGDTDRSRYVKLESLEEAQADQIRNWVDQAGQVEGWK